MSKFVRQVDGVRFINASNLWESNNDIEIQNRSRSMMQSSGVLFYDEQLNFVKCPQVGIIGVGGIPIVWSDSVGKNKIALACAPQNEISPKELSWNMLTMASFGGYMSYLNPKNKAPDEFMKVLLNNHHVSTTHMLVLNIMILGVSTSVENEFNCQRDIMHLSRLTEARTKSQNNPPICVLYPEVLKAAEEIYTQTHRSLDSLVFEDKSSGNNLEAKNILFPASKATMFVITSSVRNLLKLTSALGDAGKEEEMKRVLAMLNHSLHSLFPDVFSTTDSYGYEYPDHIKSHLT